MSGGVLTDPLWQRLGAYEFPLSTGVSLRDQVAKETELTGERASAAVQAYRQFLWLCATQGHIMAPSAAVDAVWHLHLMDTRAYAAFCDQVIGRMIHHIPGRPPVAEDPAYAATRAALAQHFGPPSPNLWPDPVAVRQAGRGSTFSFVLGFAILGAGWVSGNWLLAGLGFLVVWVGDAYFDRNKAWQVKRSDSGCGATTVADDAGGCGGGD